MRLEVKDTVSGKDLTRALRGVTWDGLATKTTITLTSGAFLVSFALQLGASNSQIGLLAAIPFLSQVLQIPSVYLVEKLRYRRPISTFAALIARSGFLLAALAPLFVTGYWPVTVLIIALTIRGAFGAISQCAWSSWMRDLVPLSQRGTFYAKRMSLAAILGMVVSLLAGYFLDWFKLGFSNMVVYSYSALFLVAFLVGMANVWVIARIPEPRMKPNGTEILSVLRKPFQDTNFKNLLKFLVAWNFAINLAAPFFSVYMLNKIKLDMTTVVALTVLSQLANIAVLRIWGRFMDRFSNKSVLKVCAPLFVVSIFLWIFTLNDGRHMMTLPLLVIVHIAMGMATAGTVLGTSNLAIRLAPREWASSYLAVSNLANSVAAGIAPIIGGRFADFFAEKKLTLIVKWTTPVKDLSYQTFKLHHWDFFFFFAFVIGMLSIWQLGRVREVGEVKPGVIVHEFFSEMGRNVKSVSTVGGLVQMTQLPFQYVKNRLNGKNGSK